MKNFGNGHRANRAVLNDRAASGRLENLHRAGRAVPDDLAASGRLDSRGYILVVTFLFLVILTIMVGTLSFMAVHETRDMGAQIEDTQMLYLSEAGVERAMREIKDDYTTSTQTGEAEIRGEDTSDSSSVGNDNRIRYEEDGNATINNNSDEARLQTFDANYTNTRIVTVLLGVRASRASGGTGATIEVSYTTNGAFPEAGNTVLTQALTTTLTNYEVNITADRVWTWDTIMSSNLILRARRTAGNRNINLDYLYLKVTYGIDTNTEPWFTGSYQAYPLSLGKGTIQSVSIIAEQGKVHLNTASQAFLRYLMQEYGIASGTADDVASNIVDYRDSNPFDSVEELQQVTGMTNAIYTAIKDDVTVYSYINTYAQGPEEARAPVNINTASRQVLEAIFDPLTFNNSSDITDLADAIIAQRNTAPFTCFYSSNSAVTTDFYDFVRAQSYLSNSEDDRVLGNADASLLVPRQGGSDEDAETTEFSYDSGAFKVESLSDIAGRRFRIKTILGHTGNKTFTNFDGDTSSIGYRQENYE